MEDTPLRGDRVRVVRVVPDVPAIHRRFDYTVPARLDAAVTVGSRVRIPLHGRRVGGWVVEDGAVPPDGITPRPLAASSGAGPAPALVALAEWAAWRWAGPVTSFLGTASPSRVVRSVVSPDRSGRDLAEALVGSPGGASVAMVAEALGQRGSPAVVRLAPTLDASLLVLEVVHRLGAAGVLVLVPARLRADRLAQRLRGAGVPVATAPDQWPEAAAGDRLVVGTRAAAWAPPARLRAAVVIDAHDEAYREERAPTWSAVDVVAERARRDGAPVLLVSPCPPVVLLETARLVTSPRAVERRGWPAVEVVDRGAEDPRSGLFSAPLVRALHDALDRPDGRVVCILNRTGRARLLACASCGELVRCTRCGSAPSQDEAGGELRCRRCGLTRPPLCAACDSTRLKLLRMGVSRAAEELGALVGTPAFELTSATEVPPRGADRLVVGTEAALHRIERADLVAFLDFDQHLLAPRFGAVEEALALLARAARLVGGRPSGGRLVVQTRIPGHEALQAAVNADPGLVAGSERALRRTLDLPPFGALALLSGPGAGDFARSLAGRDGISVGTPAARGPDAETMLVHARDHRILCDALADTPRPPGRLRVEVDPTDV